MSEPRLSTREVAAVLAARHGGGPVRDLEALAGGFWSSAFAYRTGDGDGRELVVRFGQLRDGFEADRAAMAYAGPDLPVPEVLEVGDAFDGSYAISVRAHGRFLEEVAPEEADVAGPTIVRLLGALHAVRAPVRSTASWRAFLADGLVDDPARTVHGWRPLLAEDDVADRVFRACEARVGELADACPERRDLVHGDLLHANVLVSEDAARVNAVFSWKCSVWGDFLFDAAWCTFWGHVHPGIARADVLGRVLASDWARADPGALDDAAVRHHCYELQIGASHLGWCAWTRDTARLRALAAHTAMLLEQGPGRGPSMS